MVVRGDDDLLAPDEYLVHEVLEELVAGLGCVNGGLSEALVERADTRSSSYSVAFTCSAWIAASSSCFWASSVFIASAVLALKCDVSGHG